MSANAMTRSASTPPRTPPTQANERHARLRQLVREGKMSLDEYLRVYIGVRDEYMAQARPRFEREIFRH